MKYIVLPLVLMLSAQPQVNARQKTVITCPCINKDGVCCCAQNGESCNCASEYARSGTIPAQCPCPRTECVVTPEASTTNNEASTKTLPKIEISHGELIDKITILEIKMREIKDENKLAHIASELKMLNKILKKVMKEHATKQEQVDALKCELFELNWNLWQVEDKLRIKETAEQFDDEFILLARNVYIYNDARAAAKRKISELLHSRIVEQKSYVS